MLVLSRKINQSIVIGDNIEIMLVDIRGDQIKLGINSLTKVLCEKNTEGKYHVPYEGDKKEMYSCKYCGSSYYTIKELTSELCLRNPKGKFHVPAK